MTLSIRAAVLGLVVAAISAVPAFAAPVPVTYTVVTNQSSLTASGVFTDGLGPHTILAQSAGSLVTTYAGTVTANRDFSADTVEFTGGTVSANNSGSYQPPFAAPAPGNYGTLIDYAPTPSVTLGAVRNFAFSPSSGTITGASSFNASLLSALITSGQLDFESLFSGVPIPGTLGSTGISGNFVLTTGTATITQSPGLETLTIPIHTTLTVTIDNPNDLVMQLDGVLVATTAVPEPASLALLSATVVPLLLRRRRS
jgi:hypothetical protein